MSPSHIRPPGAFSSSSHSVLPLTNFALQFASLFSLQTQPWFWVPDGNRKDNTSDSSVEIYYTDSLEIGQLHNKLEVHMVTLILSNVALLSTIFYQYI